MLIASMDPTSMAKQGDLNPPPKSEIPTKYRPVFITKQLLHTY